MPNVQGSPAEVAATVRSAPAGGVPGAEFMAWLDRGRQEVEAALESHLRELETTFGPHSRLAAAVLYSVQAGGKRLRPILVLETCRVCGGRTESALPAALAMELIHTFSLIHDDLPAMDNDDLRRGRPANHKVHGEALAILAGDWLLTHAFTLLASDRYDPGLLPGLVRTLGGGTLAMIEGQAADIEGERRAPDGELVGYIHEHKTAALLEACCRLGALCARAPGELASALARYGRHLGLAFQIADDLLDARGSAEKLGKGVGKDAAAAKQTYPAAYGLAESEARAGREVAAALEALEPFGLRADRLRDLARWVVSRSQ